MKKILLIILLTLVIAQAGTTRTVSYYGPKKAAMGGTGVAVIDKRESLYYNPAHIVDIDNTLVIPLIQSSAFIGSDTLANLSKFNLSGETSDVLESYNKLIPSRLGLGWNTSGQWVGDVGPGNLGLGMYSNNKIGAKVVNKLSPRFEAIGYADFVFPTITYGMRLDTPDTFLLKNTKVGATIKKINRYSLYDPNSNSEMLSIEVLNLISEDDNTGLHGRAGGGVGLDLGLLADMDTFMGPAKVGLALNNISTRLSGIQYENINSENMKTETPYTQDIPLSATVGLALKASPFLSIPVLDNIFPDATYATDIDIISQDKSWLKRIHLGMEQLYFKETLAWRMGLNQGFPTMGVDYKLGIYHLGLSYYTEEFGEEIGDNPQSFYVLDAGFYW